MNQILARLAALMIGLGLAFGLSPAPVAVAAAKTISVSVDDQTMLTGGQFPIGVATGSNGLLYVVDHEKSVLSVVNPKTGKMVKQITLSDAETVEPNAVLAVGDKVYALDGYLNELYVVDVKKNKLVKTVKLPVDGLQDPEVLAASKDGKKLYIGAHYSTFIQVVDTKTNKLTERYSLQKVLDLFPPDTEVSVVQTTAIAPSSDGRHLFLGLAAGFSGDMFALTGIMDTKTKQLTALDPTDDNPWGVGNTEYYDLVNVGKDIVYRSVSTEKVEHAPFTVDILDLSNPKQIKQIGSITMPARNIPYLMTYSKGYVFVTNPANDAFTHRPTSPDTVQIIDTAKRAVVGSFKSNSTTMLDGALSKDGKTIYYISGGDDDPSDPGQISVAHVTYPKTAKYAKVKGAHVVKVHSKANMSAKTVTHVRKGQKVQVLSTTKTGWAKIKAGKHTGYLPKKYLR
jgi:DNA-binding beta-propeller fold protein YncE